jgi:hypothetical protein
MLAMQKLLRSNCEMLAEPSKGLRSKKKGNDMNIITKPVYLLFKIYPPHIILDDD